MGVCRAGAVIAAALVLLVIIVPAAHATFPGQNGKIAFSSDRDANNLNLFTADPDGSGPTEIVDHSFEIRHPAWSWDGANLAFLSAGPNDIYASYPDGSAQTNLTTYRFGNLQNPTWAPTGGRIAFDSSNDNLIYILEVGTTNEQTLVQGEDPSWSPDGSQIAYQRNIGAGFDIWTVGSDGSAPTNLSNAPGTEVHPDWSPDGSKIAYEHSAPGANAEIYVMDADGSNQARLTYTSPAPVFNRSPSWSPDGTRIAFASDRDGDYEIYTMLADGNDLQQITDHPGRDDFPAWQPLATSVTGFYPRPAGATPIRASLVTAFQGCASPNRTHGPPLEHPSCNPPVREASGVTVGSPDANGYAASSVGSVRIATVWHPGPPDDSDVRIDVSVTDVHCTFGSALCAGGGTLPDYAGELRATAELRVTDRDNQTPYPGPAWPATGTIARVFANVPCAPTPSSAVGSACSTATTLNSVVPGLVKEGLRSIWELGPIEVHSGGGDGDVNTTGDNTPFLAQGLFVP